MNGPIAQIVALTCFGNAFLQESNVSEFFPNNSTCTFCDRINFVTFKKSFFGKPREKEVAKTPEEWFETLKSAGANGIRLTRTPQNDPNISDRMSAGFVGGGGTWSMEAILPKKRSELWVPRWEVWDQDAPEQRIWRVTYGCFSNGTTAKPEPADLDKTATRLTQALREIHSFSIRHDCGGFIECFANALGTLDSGRKHLHGYHKDLAPDGHLSTQALTILYACQSAWVFGGMGSWNDMGFEGEAQNEYERVSEKLFQEINEAIALVTNESYHSLEQG